MFKSALKLCYYPLRTLVLIILIAAIIVGGRLFYIFKTGRTGNLLRQEVLTALEHKGLLVEFESVYFLPTKGIVLNNVFWHGSSGKDAFFIQAKQIILGSDVFDLTFSPQKLDSVSINNALASFYLHNEKKPLHLSGINFNINLNPRSWEVFDSSLSFETCRISCNGTITTPPLFTGRKKFDTQQLLSAILASVRKSYKKLSQLEHTYPPAWEHLQKLYHNSTAQKYTITSKVSFNIPWQQPLDGSIIANISIPTHIVRGVQIKETAGSFVFNNNTLSTKNLKVKIDENEHLTVDASYNFETREFSGSGDIKIYPERASAIIAGYLPKVAKVIQKVRSFGKPFHTTFAIPPQPISASDFTAKLNVKITDFIYNDELTFNKLFGKIIWNSRSLDFAIDEVVFNNKATSGSFNGVYLHKAGELLLDAQFTGDPSFVSAFLPKKGRKVYLDICHSFEWNENAPPSFNFLLRNTHKKEHTTQLNGTMSMAGFNLYKSPVKMLHTGINLQMTNEDNYVLLHDLSLITEQGDSVTGSGCYEFPDTRKKGLIKFSAHSTSSPQEIFRLITLDKIAKKISFINFKEKLGYNVDGNFDLETPELSAIQANLECKSLDIDEYNLQNCTADVKLQSNRLSVNDIKYQFGGGDTVSHFEYDFSTDKSAVYIQAKDFDISHIPVLKGKSTGKGQLQLHLGMQFSPSSKTPILSGSGKVAITEGKFWKIPLLSSLANSMNKILPIKGLGEITEISSELKFADHRVKIRKLNTNGSIISFKGRGEVNVAKKNVDITLETKPLADVLWSVIPVLLRPITKSIQIKLEGSYDNLKWKPTSGLW